MSNSFDFEQFKANAIEQLKAGVPLSGKDGVLVPLAYSGGYPFSISGDIRSVPS